MSSDAEDEHREGERRAASAAKTRDAIVPALRSLGVNLIDAMGRNTASDAAIRILKEVPTTPAAWDTGARTCTREIETPHGTLRFTTTIEMISP